MTAMQTRKLDQARLSPQAAHSMAMKYQAQRRRKGMQDSAPVSVKNANYLEICYQNRTVVFQFDKGHMAKKRAEFARQNEHSISFLLTMANAVMEGLHPRGIASLRAHSAQISFSYAHANKSAVDFLTLYFAENPHDSNEINRRFIAARWTEEFDPEELHTAYLNALCVRESIIFWNTTVVPVSH